MMDQAAKRKRKLPTKGPSVSHAYRVTNRIHALREAQGLSLEALARRVGTTNQQISHLEAGRRRLTVDWLCRLGQALACHPWALVSEASSESLPAEETGLLHTFRALPVDQRHALLTLVNALQRPSAATPRRRRK